MKACGTPSPMIHLFHKSKRSPLGWLPEECVERLSDLRDPRNSSTLARSPRGGRSPSTAIGCSSCNSNSCQRRMTYDAHEHLDGTRCGISAEFALGCLQGRKNSARERAIEDACGGTAERERPIEKRSGCNDGGPGCVGER